MTGRKIKNKSICFINHLRRFVQNESGATAIEYGLLAALLAVGLIVGANGIGNAVSTMWNGVSSDISAT